MTTHDHAVPRKEAVDVGPCPSCRAPQRVRSRISLKVSLAELSTTPWRTMMRESARSVGSAGCREDYKRQHMASPENR
jgi:hypothetical protein